MSAADDWLDGLGPEKTQIYGGGIVSSAIAAMARWFDENSNTDGMRVSFREGPGGRPVKSAQLGFETAGALASVAVWENGQLEAEVLVVEGMERPLVVSTVVSTPAAMIHIIERVKNVTWASEQ